MNEIIVHLQGNVATQPEPRRTPSGRAVTSFRLAVTPRRYDAELGWQDQPTSWVTVTCWNGLAENATFSLKVGEPVVLLGRLRVREWERDGRKGTEVEVEALGLGHDLRRGVTSYRRVPQARRPEEAGVGAAAGDEPLDPFDPEGPTRPGEEPTAPERPGAPAAPGAPGAAERVSADLADPFATAQEDGADPGVAALGEPVGAGGRLG